MGHSLSSWSSRYDDTTVCDVLFLSLYYRVLQLPCAFHIGNTLRSNAVFFKTLYCHTHIPTHTHTHTRTHPSTHSPTHTHSHSCTRTYLHNTFQEYLVSTTVSGSNWQAVVPAVSLDLPFSRAVAYGWSSFNWTTFLSAKLFLAHTTIGGMTGRLVGSCVFCRDRCEDDCESCESMSSWSSRQAPSSQPLCIPRAKLFWGCPI